ncbi:MAG TPA: protoporphyrinogen oxidase [Candidatus Kapabacteria bacterium]|nr:protoporphyrinogen oxidase [Candidatus Kapabacteria bacterium]
MNTDVVVIGGGISGLAAAYFQKKKDRSVLLLEKATRIGGSIHTEQTNDFLFEYGPNSTTLSNPAIKELISELNLDSKVLFPGANGKKRFILKNGKLAALPISPVDFLFGDFFSVMTKLRIADEPLLPRGKKNDESVAAFFTRRFGKNITDTVVRPFVSGIYAGDADQLSARSTFPSLFETEREYGSIIGGQIKKMLFGKKKARSSGSGFGKLFSFDQGLHVLTDALATTLGESVHTGAEILALSKSNDGWQVEWRQNGAVNQTTCHSVIISTPAYVTAQLVHALSPELADKLNSVQYAPIGVVHTAYKRSSVSHPLDGFGFLVPPKENRKILGCIFSSSLFPNRAPKDNALLTTFVGGATQKEILSGTQEEILRSTNGELQSILGISGEPVFSQLTIIPRAIPQYNLGHHTIIEAVDSFEKEHPNLFFCNNFRGGVSIANCVQAAKKLAETI